MEKGPGVANDDMRRDPAAALPLEIVSEIFQLVTDTSRDSAVNQKKNSQIRALLTLSHVSSGWRNILNGDNSLWSKITLSVHSSSDLIAHVCDVVIPRLHSTPLTIHLDDVRFTDEAGDIFPAGEHRVNLIKIPLETHLDELGINLLSDDDITHPDFLAFLDTLAGRPRSLRLHAGGVNYLDRYRGREEGWQWSLSVIFTRFRNLERLHLCYILSKIHIDDQESWKSLTELVIEEPDETFPLSKFLAVVPNLQELDVRIHGPCEIERDNTRPPSHGAIVKMHLPFIEFVGWRPNVDPVLRGYFPSLRELRVDLETRFLREFLVAHPHLDRVSMGGSAYRSADGILNQTKLGEL